jgi:hypothetical protein
VKEADGQAGFRLQAATIALGEGVGMNDGAIHLPFRTKPHRHFLLRVAIRKGRPLQVLLLEFASAQTHS